MQQREVLRLCTIISKQSFAEKRLRTRRPQSPRNSSLDPIYSRPSCHKQATHYSSSSSIQYGTVLAIGTESDRFLCTTLCRFLELRASVIDPDPEMDVTLVNLGSPGCQEL